MTSSAMKMVGAWRGSMPWLVFLNCRNEMNLIVRFCTFDCLCLFCIVNLFFAVLLILGVLWSFSPLGQLVPSDSFLKCIILHPNVPQESIQIIYRAEINLTRICVTDILSRLKQSCGRVFILAKSCHFYPFNPPLPLPLSPWCRNSAWLHYFQIMWNNYSFNN